MAEELGQRAKVPITFEVIYDFEVMLKLGIGDTPSVRIDGEELCAGRMPNKAELADWIQARLCR